MIRFLLATAVLGTAVGFASAQNPREKKVRDDRTKVEGEGFWIYNDFAKAKAEAKSSGKPMVVALRCIPCEECVKLDDHLVDQDPNLRPLLEQFVRVRIVSTNGLDLSLFQFDTDQSFAMFFLNADGTIYGRFGTRSHRTNWVGDVSIAGLKQAMAGALDIHKSYPANKDALAGKRGPAPKYPVPEKFPTLTRYGPKLNYEVNLVQSCIHCHQIGDALKESHRKSGEAIPDDVLFPFPHPKSQGLILDPKERATVLEVQPGSTADKSGFRAGDRIESLNGQPLLSIADVQWVLHRANPRGDVLSATVERDRMRHTLAWTLPPGWRESDDISWRSSTWGLRRMALGGVVLDPVETRPAGIPADGMALSVRHVGEFGNHAVAKKAGVQKGDILIRFDGRNDLKRESDVLAYALRNRKPGDTVPLTFLRNGKTVAISLLQQP